MQLRQESVFSIEAGEKRVVSTRTFQERLLPELIMHTLEHPAIDGYKLKAKDNWDKVVEIAHV